MLCVRAYSGSYGSLPQATCSLCVLGWLCRDFMMLLLAGCAASTCGCACASALSGCALRVCFVGVRFRWRAYCTSHWALTLLSLICSRRWARLRSLCSVALQARTQGRLQMHLANITVRAAGPAPELPQFQGRAPARHVWQLRQRALCWRKLSSNFARLNEAGQAFEYWMLHAVIGHGCHLA